MEHDNLYKKRHSLSHIMASAVLSFYPDTKLAIGPAIDNGFYYDFDFTAPLSDKDLGKIEQKMREILKKWSTFDGKEISEAEARKLFADNPYKLELIDGIVKNPDEKLRKITVYTSGDFTDLCAGGHVDNVKEIESSSFKLDRVAGAYWRGDEKNKMLTRIYGLAFENKTDLEEYIKKIEEAKSRDHKKIGKELDLFTFSELVGAGLPLWTPKGTILRTELDNFVWELRSKYGYDRVEIPHITKKALYEKSGHWEKFKEELFKIETREGHVFVMKPMNCPHHTQIYARKLHSYRELPQRYANTTMVYRDEQSGELSGLSRVRCITQDDAHVFCRNNQIKGEMLKIWDIINTFYGVAGFKLTPRLSLHDPEQMQKYLGTEEIWQNAENSLREIVKEKGVTAIEAKGEAAFYGPKIDFMAKDSLGREWQVATIQLDMNLPERFDLYCTGEKGEQERIVMIHCAIMGSIERYLSILIEHFAGNFPVWLAPTQVKIIPVRENHNEYAKKIADELKALNVRVDLDDTDEGMGKKIRNGKNMKVPYMLVIGDKEIESGELALEIRDGAKQEKISLENLKVRLQKEIHDRV